MNLTAYEIAVIGGGFAIAGTLIGAIVAYWLSVHLSSNQQRSVAAANFRAAFSIVISQMAIAQTDKKINIESLLVATFPDLAVAIETYRPFIHCEDRQAYQETWENYYLAGRTIRTVRFFDYDTEISSNGAQSPFDIFSQRIEDILRYAPL